MLIDKASYFSKKVTFLNVMLTFLIVVLHAGTPGRWGVPMEEYPLIYGVSAFAQIGVPMFFFISGLLFYRNCCFKDIERKLHSRVRSLLVPYLLWNTLFVGVYFILAHISFIHERMNMGNDVLNNPAKIIQAIINSGYTPLWFVKNLMIFCLLSAGIFIALKNKVTAFGVLVLSVILALSRDYPYEHIFMWLPIYFSGAIIGKYYAKEAEPLYIINTQNRLYNYGCTVLLSVVFGGLYVVSMVVPNSIFCFRLFSPVIIWFLTDCLLKSFLDNTFQVKPWMNYMFFIYCTHYFLLNVIQKFVMLTCPPTSLVLNVTFIVSPVVTVWVLIVAAGFLSRYRFYAYLSGGR